MHVLTDPYTSSLTQQWWTRAASLEKCSPLLLRRVQFPNTSLWLPCLLGILGIPQIVSFFQILPETENLMNVVDLVAIGP